MASAMTGDGVGLAGISAADNIYRPHAGDLFMPQGTNVRKDGNSGPACGEDGPAELIALTERDGAHACPLKSEREATNA